MFIQIRMDKVPKDSDSPIVMRLKPRPPFAEAKEKFLEEVRKVAIPKIKKTKFYPAGHPKAGEIESAQRDLIIGTIGRTENFGFGKTRAGYKEFAANKKYPELFRAVVVLGNSVVPKGWRYSAITLNHGVRAKKHTDKTNVGFSVIVGIGDYTGGGLYIYNPEGTDKKLFDIKDSPALFNGAILPHQTQPFKGERYTLIFYSHKEGARIPGIKSIGMGHGDDEVDLEGGVFA